jgi:hypothetical protein
MFGTGPFRRLVVAHSVSVAADALFTVSLAGSLLFSVSADAARPRILVYLLLTLAPFAVVGPFLGPVVDRVPGGQRVLLVASCLGRLVASLLIVRHLTTLLFFPEAFAVLVLGKTTSVAKSVLVPWLVRDESALVGANARLARMSALSAGVMFAAGAALLGATSARVVLLAAAAVYLAAAVLAARVPQPHVRRTDPVVEEVELRGDALRLASNGMSVLRAAVGFLAFLLAFNLKQAGEPPWVFGLAIAASGVGALAGTVVAEQARKRLRDETLLVAALGAPGVLLLLCAIQYRRPSAMVAAFAIGVGANAGRHAFDSITQRLAPDAEKGRAFARFETQFQLAWVVGALVPVLADPSPAIGLGSVGVALSAMGILCWTGFRAAHHHEVVVRAQLDPAQADPAASLLSLANALRAQGADRMAVLTAIGAARAARAAGDFDTCVGPSRPPALEDELERLWQAAATGAGELAEGDADRAIRLSRSCVRAAARARIGPSSNGARTNGEQPLPTGQPSPSTAPAAAPP